MLRHEEFLRSLQSIVADLGPDLRADGEQHVATLIQSGVDSVEALQYLLYRSETNSELRATACWLLGRLGDKRSVPALSLALKDGAAEVREAAAESLGILGDKRAARALLSSLADANALVRAAAARSLGHMGSRRALKPLIRTMLSDEAEEARMAATHALGALGDSRALDAMAAVMNNLHETPQVRGMAAEQLVTVGGDRKLDQLRAALRDSSPDVRFWAAFALGEIGAAEALPDLQRLAETDEAVVPGWRSVKQEAQDAIALIKKHSAQRDRE